MFRFLIFLIILSVTQQLVAATPEKKERTVSPPPLHKDQGYMLIKLNIEAESAFLYYTKKVKNRIKYKRSSKKISLSKHGNGFVIIPLKFGKYQISKIEVPFFDYPYNLITENDKDYSFVIKPNKINFIGSLTIKKERTENTIYVEIFRDFARYMDELNTIYADILQRYPLVSGSSYRDDFIKDITNQQ